MATTSIPSEPKNEEARRLELLLEAAFAEEANRSVPTDLASTPPPAQPGRLSEPGNLPAGRLSPDLDSFQSRGTASVDARSNANIAPCLSAVMPVFNEEATIAQAVSRVLAQRPVRELIVVDDASRDHTWEVLQKLGQAQTRLKLFRHERNQGKGAALRTGFQHTTSPIVIIQDADMEYDPSEYHLLLAPILSDKADVVFGSRFIGAGAHRVLYFWHSVGNKFLTTLSNMATNLNLTDMESGYKVFRREVLQRVTLEESRFGFEPEITAKVSKLNVRIYEVPISYYGRTYEEGKKINWKDGFSALRCVLKYNLLR